MQQSPIAIRLENLGVRWRDAVGLAGRLGADAVEFDAVGELSPRSVSQTGRREIRHTLRQHGIKIAAIGFPTRHGYQHLDRIEQRIDATIDALKFAYDLGAPIVINQMGQAPEEDSPAREAFIDVLRRLGSAGERVGARLAFQTTGESIGDLPEVLERVGSPGLAVNLAPAHLLLESIDVVGVIEQLSGWLAGVHAQDVVRSPTALGGLREVPLGEGEINWRRLQASLDAVHYRGHVTMIRESRVRNAGEWESALRWWRGP